MSPVGQKRKCARPRGMSVRPSGPDTVRLHAQVRFVPLKLRGCNLAHERPLCARSCPWRARNPTSALSPKPDSTRQSRHVRNVPLPDSCSAANRSLFGCREAASGQFLGAFFKNPITSKRITAPMTALTISATMTPTRTDPIRGKSQPAMKVPIMPTTMLPTSPKP